MKKLAVLLSILSWAGGLPSRREGGDSVVTTTRLQLQPQIVGGQNATAGEFPWQCSLKQVIILGLTLHICGAVVYDEKTILTAAHCVETTQDLSKLRVTCGEYDFSYTEGPEQNRDIQSITVHPLRNIETKEFDLAYLTLEEPLQFNDMVRPVRIAEQEDVQLQRTGGLDCINTGWGNTRGDGSLGSSLVLLKVNLPLVPFENCKKRYEDLIELKESMICAGHINPEDAEEQKGPCNGDSGGPLVCPGSDGELRLVGIVSFGTNPCALFEYPGVFANVAHLAPWLQQISSKPHQQLEN